MTSTTLLRLAAIALPPALALIMLVFDPPGTLSAGAWRTSACLVWMALWWMTEALPVSVTAMLPIILFPLLGIADIKTATSAYAHPTVYLFMGGFLLALAIEKWNLHRRVALAVLLSTGGSARALIGGFMVTASLLSMWISNTATTIMLLPIGLAIITVVGQTVTGLSQSDRSNFQTALMLGIAYAATIGGVATLIGTPPNTFMAGFLQKNFDMEISFVHWMAVGLPVTLTMLPLAWWLLVRYIFPFNFSTSAQTHTTLAKMKAELGPVSREEKIIATVFALTALAWTFRPVIDDWLTRLTDPGIAMIAGLSMFIIPASRAVTSTANTSEAGGTPSATQDAASVGVPDSTQDTTDGTRATTNGTQDTTDGTRATTNGMQDNTDGTLATTNGTPTLTNGSTNGTLTTTTEAATDGTQAPAADRIVDGAAQPTFAQPAPAPVRLLGWQDTTRLPWGILLLFGGGLALAAAISSSGLAAAIGALFSNMDTVEIFLVVAIIATVVVFLTELTSNLATTATFLPVVAAVALQFGVDPMVFVVPVALAASCAFMLPVATPPNAIVFSSGMIRIPQMARAGLLLNACAIVIVSVVSMVLVPAVLVAVN